MKVLITGATGFIGKPLCRALLLKDHDVVALVRDADQARAKLPYPMEFVSWDGSEKGLSDRAVDGALDEIDAIVHLAGEPIIGKRWNEEQKARILSSRINSAESLIRKLQKLPEAKRPKVFLSGSAVGFYGDRGDELLTENSTPGTGFLSEVCQKWEGVVKPLEEMSIRRVIMRTGAVLGREGGMLKTLLPVFKAGMGGPVGDGKQWVSWIHIDDMVASLVYLLENEKARGVFNGVSPEPVTNRVFSQALAKAVHRPALFTAPAFGLKAALGEASAVVLASERVLPEKLERQGFQFRFKRLDDALKNLCEVDQLSGQKELYVEQWLPKSVDEIFPFFSEAENLGELTPKFLDFKILSKSTPRIEAGTLIDYQMKIHGIPIRWQTRIEEWKPGQYFSDTQLKGPYKKWHHTHRFLPMKGGTLLTDRVLYQLPMGALGGLAAGWKVRSDVSEIFKYRFKVISERFGSSDKRASA
jgi:uncharacterized protein (TIGR01777 family)